MKVGRFIILRDLTGTRYKNSSTNFPKKNNVLKEHFHPTKKNQHHPLYTIYPSTYQTIYALIVIRVYDARADPRYIATEARRRLSARVYIYVQRVHVTIYDGTSPRRLVLALDIWRSRGQANDVSLTLTLFLGSLLFFFFPLDSQAFLFDLQRREARSLYIYTQVPSLWAV